MVIRFFTVAVQLALAVLIIFEIQEILFSDKAETVVKAVRLVNEIGGSTKLPFRAAKQNSETAAGHPDERGRTFSQGAIVSL